MIAGNLARNRERIRGSIQRSNRPMDAGIVLIVRVDSERFWGFTEGFMGIVTYK